MGTTSDRITFPVWVGSLAESVNDNVLFSYFEKFGPIYNVKVMKDMACKSKNFGYVNFYNEEVAEVAARDMNGIEICGKRIKTKGPQQVKLHSPTKENHNSKRLTDCYYYVLSGKCTPRNYQECIYRHISRLRTVKQICEKWESKTCDNVECLKLHPSQKYFAEKVKTGVRLQRCESHNAFKCFGDCGNDMCQTHFDDERSLIDHVLEEKKSIPSCPTCHAVFFNIEERENHHHANQQKSKVAKKVSKTLENTIEPIGVFWDIENCCVPKNKCALSFVAKIRKHFYDGKKEVQFMCVCDIKKQRKDVIEDLNKAQITVVHTDAASKNAADDKLKQALRQFADLHKSPATVVLVSGDVNFSSEVSDLRHRHNIHVVLIHNKQANNALIQAASEAVKFESFTVSLPNVVSPAQGGDENNSNRISGSTNDVYISNLPNKIFPHKKKGRLQALANNTGGRVLVADKGFAIVRFKSPEDAQRGAQRLDQEDVFGSKIQASLKMKKTSNANKDNLKCEKSFVHTNLKKHNSKSAYSLNQKVNPLVWASQMNIVPDEKPPIQRNSLHKLSNSGEDEKPCLPPLMSQFVPPLPNGGVDLLVRNLRPSVNDLELKKSLLMFFRQHTKVLSLNIKRCRNEARAVVKVPKMSDAQSCVLMMNNMELFNQQVTLSLNKRSEDGVLFNLREEVKALLSVQFTGWLPLEVFLKNYKSMYKKMFQVFNFDHLKDLVYVGGFPGSQFVCLLPFPVGLLKVKNEPFFKDNLVATLHKHRRKVPLASVPGLYWSLFKKELPLNENGTPFLQQILNERLVLTGNPPSQFVYYKNTHSGANAIEEFFAELVLLLSSTRGFKIPLDLFVGEYHKYFGQQLCLAQFGCKSLNELLLKVGHAAEITFENNKKVLSLSASYKRTLLQQELTALLKARPKLPLNSLLTSYYMHYGRKLITRNFDFSNISDLVNSLGETLQVIGPGDGKVLQLIKEDDVMKSKSLPDITKDIVKLVRQQAEKKLYVGKVYLLYEQMYGCKVKPSDFGFGGLKDLLLSMSKHVVLEKLSIDGCLYDFLYIAGDKLAQRDLLWHQIKSLLAKSPKCALLGTQIPVFYQEMFGTTFPLDGLQLHEFLKESPADVMSIGNGPHNVLVMNSGYEYPENLLVKQLTAALCEREGFNATAEMLSLSLQNIHIHVSPLKILQVVSSNPSFVVCKSTVQLSIIAARKIFEENFISMFHELKVSSLSCNQFMLWYVKHFHKQLDLFNYDATSVQNLFQLITPGIAKLRQQTVSLGPLGKFYFEFKAVVDDREGAILLSNFIPEFNRKFKKTFTLAEYGFKKVSDLIECFSSIFTMYGEKNKKVVVSNDRLLQSPGSSEKKFANLVGNNDCDVIIESGASSQDPEEDKDLLEFYDDDVINPLIKLSYDDDDAGSNTEWWMEPIPNILEPALTPELSQQDQLFSDLISFQFGEDCDIFNAGLS